MRRGKRLLMFCPGIILLIVSCISAPGGTVHSPEVETLVEITEEASTPEVLPVPPDVGIVEPRESSLPSFLLPVPEPRPLLPPLYPWQDEDTPLVKDGIVRIVVEEAVEQSPSEQERPQDRKNEPSQTLPAVLPVSSPAAEPVSSTGRDLGNLEAAVGVPFDYTLPGNGWVFEGSSPEGVRLIKRSIQDGSTVFTLIRAEDKPFRVTFIYNDVIENRSERVVLSLRSPSEEQEEPEAWVLKEEPEESIPEMAVPSVAEIVAEGFYETLHASDEAAKEGDATRALDILHLGETVYRGHRNLDRMFFALASLYEEPGPRRDINRSLHYYKRVVDNYPASIFFHTARDRIMYLERNFIHIR